MSFISETTARFYFEQEMDEAELITASGASLAAYSRTCPGKEAPNDDSAVIIEAPNGAIVMAVADGVGGAPLGYKASAIAMQCLAESVADHKGGQDLRPAILDGIENGNAEVLDLGVGAATTITVVEINRRIARGYQVGDSMALIMGQRGAVKWKSKCHSPVGYAIESGMIDEEDAMHHEERHFVSNLVGTRDMHIDIGPAVELSARDAIVVCSDGLSDNVHLYELAEHGRSGPTATRMNSLIDLASRRMRQIDQCMLGKPDDLTLLMMTP